LNYRQLNQKDLKRWYKFIRWLKFEKGDKDFYLREFPLSQRMIQKINWELIDFPQTKKPISMLEFMDWELKKRKGKIFNKDVKIFNQFQEMLKKHFNNSRKC